MQDAPIKLAVIIGSVRGGRFSPTVARWFTRQAERHGGVEAELVDLADHPLPLIMPDFGEDLDAPTQSVVDGLAAKLAAADAFVVVTPEYNHSTSPALKNAIDWYLDEWKTKPVGLVSYGGQGGGLRAAEHLRQIFAEVHATTVRDVISFHNSWSDFEADGEPASPEGSEEAAKSLLEQLIWWGSALRDARAKTPYTS
ncbi:FMN reductase [Streptomyces abyssalis]|uniref:FMN reductase n=1 Tax=Streptomyces abyssalis TaxID=933944 RepID=A0A1E7JGR9_9ACTN|nr:NAD(P)H-dependent oxidoreductase [Streptomyces abyssalis]OEU85652.1 FMN reductase [Streptomyces abyssalis]OEU92884.1 FMN reductase [Streptomyces abyssalis]OEV30510.1 FMN reductase [Streptomyces nanshensis]